MPWAFMALALLGQGIREERGKYKLSFFGNEGGMEEFRIEEFEDGHVVLFSKARFDVVLQDSRRSYFIDTALTLDKDWKPILYGGYHKVGSEERLSKIEWKGGAAVVNRKQVVKTSAPYVLDANVFAHLIPLLRRYGGDRRPVKVFSPVTLRDMEVSVEDRGEEILHGAGRTVAVRQYRVGLGSLGTITAHVDGQKRMIRAWNPMVSGLAELEGFEGLAREEGAVGIEQVEIEFSSGAVRLTGTLARPKQEGTFPALVFLSDEGPHDRDGNRPGGTGWGGFRYAARRLAGEGVMSLRFDDRGYGRSGGKFETARWQDLLADGRSALAILRGRGGVGPLGVVGHGQGGLAAIQLAAEDEGIRAIFLLGASSRPWHEVLLERMEGRWRREGMNEERVASLRSRERDLFEKILHSEGDYLEIDEQPTFVAGFRELFRVDPVAEIRRVKGAVVIFHGSMDTEVGPSHAARLQEAKPGVEVRVLEGLDHDFRPAAGRPGDLEGPAVGPDEAFLKVLVEGVRERLR